MEHKPIKEFNIGRSKFLKMLINSYIIVKENEEDKKNLNEEDKCNK